MKIIIIRHGDPDYEHDSLTEKGFREAELLSNRITKLDVKNFYCSILGRARATAKPTLDKLGREAEYFDWLQEFPAYTINPETGKKEYPWDFTPDFIKQNPDLMDKDKWKEIPIIKSGNANEEYKHVCTELDKLFAKHGYVHEGRIYRAVNPNSDTIVIFCHFALESILLSHIFSISPYIILQNFIALPTSVTTLISEEREDGIAIFRCSSFGDLSHLNCADEPASFSGRFCEMFANKDERH